MITAAPATVRASRAATPSIDAAFAKAFGLDIIRAENRRLVAFGFEMLSRGGWECVIGDRMDVIA